MDLTKARQFADTAFSAELRRIARETTERITDLREQLAGKGILNSSTAVIEAAKINGQMATTLLQVRLDCLLEGLELHGVVIDEELSTGLLTELTRYHNELITKIVDDHRRDSFASRLLSSEKYKELLEQSIDWSRNALRTKITRRRLMPKKGTNISVTYHVTGHNNRWTMNSQDHSVNVVTQSSDQVFATLRQEIESKVPAGDEQRDILDRLSTLEQAQNTPSFAQRYTDFIAAAANHMVLVGPFIPALTEMLHKVIS